MLVQSTSGRIVLLPALPEEWSNGSVKGLCVRGGAEIDLVWRKGRLLSCELRAKADLKTTILYENMEMKPAGEETGDSCCCKGEAAAAGGGQSGPAGGAGATVCGRMWNSAEVELKAGEAYTLIC